MRKTISLICLSLLISAFGVFATPNTNQMKQNANKELTNGKTKHKVPVITPTRKQLSTNIHNIQSTGRLSVNDVKPSLAPLFAPGDGTNIYGWLNYYDDPTHEWNQVGLNQIFSDGTYSTIFKCWDSPSMAFYHDNKVYTLTTEFDDMGIYILGAYFATYDFETGELLSGPDNIPLDDTCIGAFINVAYNHNDNSIYGYTYDYASSTGITFAKIILTNPTNVISVRKEVDPSEICSAMTYHEGKIHGINFKGEYVTIDLSGNQTAHFTPTFEKNNTVTLNYGSIIYSPALGGFLWANMYDADNSAHLYKLDTTAESAIKLADYDRMEQYIGFMTPTYEANPAAPNYIEIIENTFAGTPNNFGSITIQVPTTTIDGSKIPQSQLIDVTLLIGNEETWVESYAPGAEATIELRNLPEGLNTFTLVGSIDGIKTRKAYPICVGHDTPKAPENVVLTVDGITWDAVTSGLYGGYFEPKNVTYTIYINDERIARNITETHFEYSFEDGEYEAYVAEVYAECNGKESAPGYSNPIVAGAAVSLDYFCEPAPEDYPLYTVINTNDDTFWEYRQADNNMYHYDCFEIAAYNMYTNKYGIDDWLILPPLKFEDGNELYSIAAEVANVLDIKPYSTVNYTIYLGTAPTPEAMTRVIGQTRGIDGAAFKNYIDKFEIHEAGNYYIGIHAEYTGNPVPLPVSLLIRNILVKEENVSLGGPAAVTDVVVTPAEKGELNATVAFNMPTTTIDGETLAADETITAYIETEMAYDPVEGKPGERVSLNVETIQGDNIIRICPFIGKSRGYEIEVEAYTGVDVPGPVENVKEVIAEDNKSLLITWDAPSIGEYGGYINPTGNKYYCVVATANGWEVLEEIGYDKFEYEYIHRGNQMEIVQFGIAVENEAGMSPAIAISTSVLGEPYTLPMIEGYPGYSPTYGPCYSYEANETYSALWRVTELYYDDIKQMDFRREDGSGFALACSPRRTDPKSKGRFMLPKFSTIDTKEPVLKFDAWIYPDMPTVDIYAEAPGIAPTKVGTIFDENYEGWQVITLTLPEEFKGKGWVSTYIEVSFNKYEQIFFLDNYEFKDNLANDFEVSSLSGKRRPSIYDDAKYEAKVTNRGYVTSVAPKGKWQVFNGDKLIIEEEVNAPNDKQHEEHAVIVYPFTLNAQADHLGESKVVFSLMTPDENAKNDSASFDIVIEKGNALTVTDLEARVDEKGEIVELTWSEPKADQLVEGFEDCATFDANATQLGEFKNIDVDGLETYGYNGWFRPNINPETGHGEAASFIVWNAEEANKVAEASGAAVSYSAHSGDNFAIAFVPFPTEAYVAPAPANDWLISPEIKGGSEVSLAVRPLYYAYGPEVLRVMASTTTDDIEAFTVVETLEIGKYSNPNLDPEWETVTVTLPKDAKYFALNYVSQDIFGLMLDDITYTPYVTNEITGYDIYRNNEVIENNLNVLGSYSDKNTTYGETYAYNVLPVTTTGAGKMSNTAIVTVTSVGKISTNNFIIGAKGAIKINGFEGENATIYTTDGKTIFNETIDKANTTVKVDAGVYVVKAGKTTVKVIVK